MPAEWEDGKLIRSNQLLFKKFSQYLIPTMVTYAALSLNEFVDSMLVSNLLDSDALAIVSLGAPLMLAMAALYLLLGSGGATVYAIAVGRRDRKAAGESCTCAVISALVAGVLVLVLGFLFSRPLAGVLCHDQGLLIPFTQYMHVLLISAPAVIMILAFVTFLPSAGYPGFAMVINVIANVVNIVMDVVFIRVFHMGVEGAAWATVTGYLIGLVLMLIAFASGKVKIYFSRKIGQSFASLKEVMKLGRPDATNQIGLALQFAVCNFLAASAAGADGVVAFSLCLQSSSVMSVFIGAVIGASSPMLAVLHGQRDYSGEAGILKRSMVSQLLMSIAGMILFIIFAPQAAALYNITEPGQLAMAVTALRIYALIYIPRDAVIVFYRYLKVIDLSNYSTLLSALDSFAAIIPVAFIMVQIAGINGLFWAFPVTSVILLILMFVLNRVYEKRSGGRLKGAFLIEQGQGAKPLLDVTISNDPNDISGISMTLQKLCEESGLARRVAIRAALAVEEIAVYVAGRKRQSSHADVLVRLNEGNVEIDFRNIGEAFDPSDDQESDIEENVRMLRGIASSIETEYILGMNSTRIVIEGQTAGE